MLVLFMRTRIFTKRIFSQHSIVHDFMEDTLFDKGVKRSVNGCTVAIMLNLILNIILRECFVRFIKHLENFNPAFGFSQVVFC